MRVLASSESIRPKQATFKAGACFQKSLFLTFETMRSNLEAAWSKSSSELINQDA